MSCLTIQVSELGTFLKIEDGALVDVLVDLWDGQLSDLGPFDEDERRRNHQEPMAEHHRLHHALLAQGQLSRSI